ncbi:hypothetical protein Dsin_012102 [Dipteronia sinensis]|uniref:Uncharacterized protein n=1 Tax=Dipteronia sinensis TaxID=43782 RepID=A0AAE0AHG3_9ROSI|nr:hypothetical protein Dsin_012102 [Dipteronia sinensis]
MGLSTEMSLRLVVAQLLLLMVANAALIAKPGCRKECGELDSIPYPFGTEAGCYLNETFLINCSTRYSPPRPFLRKSNILVTNITMEGRLQVQSLVSKDCYRKNNKTPANFRIGQFSISETQNKFTVIGCNSYGYIRGKIGEKNYSAGCISSCERPEDVTDGSCSGFGCCQIDIPEGLKRIRVEANSFKSGQNVSQFNPCSYAFVIEASQFNFSSSNLSSTIAKRVPTAVDWAITGQGNCTEAKNNQSYACKENAVCYEPADHSAGGYLCKCQDGYQGNPYLSNGCKDNIDECKLGIAQCHDHADCVDIEGSYRCECSKGYNGDGKQDGKGCIPNQLSMTMIVLGVGLGFVMLLVVSSWIYIMFKKRRLIKLKEKFFQQNGGFLLQQQLSKRSGTCDTARIFNVEELKNATNNFDEKRIIGRGGYGTVYKGFLIDNNPVAIKKSKIVDQSQIEQFINEVTVLSQINHRNVVKLLGCCLETEVPLLVYEYVTNGTLFEHIHNNDNAPTIPWETRLRIAAETAGVLSYLHSGAATPIIHRDVKSSNILLDDNFTAKVSDFGASKLVPMDVTQLSTMVQGTLGYLDPEYLHTSQLTEKSDVYSFGVVLVELMTGKKVVSFDRPEEERSLVRHFLFSLKGGSVFEILENGTVNDDNKDEMREVAELARRCLRVKGEERPTMKEVAMELEGLRRMNKHLWDNVEVNIEETEHLLSETSYACNYGDVSNSTAAYNSMKDHALVSFDGGHTMTLFEPSTTQKWQE